MRVDVQGFHGQIEQRSDQSAITCGITCERRNQKVETKSVHLAWRREDALFFSFPISQRQRLRKPPHESSLVCRVILFNLYG
jgi:hypothetical protein